MPTGMRSSLIVILLCTGFAAQAASERGTTWTDPPARTPDAAKAESQPAVPATPAAVSPQKQKAASVVRRKPVPPRRVAARPHPVRVVNGPQRVYRRPSRVVMAPSPGPVMRRYAYPIYSQAGVSPTYEDERLDRLNSAVRSGYLVVHRRSVEYPDGRLIRYYRPYDDDGME